MLATKKASLKTLSELIKKKSKIIERLSAIEATLKMRPNHEKPN